MRRITALSLGIALVGPLAGAPAAATSVEDERTEAILATVVGQDPNASLVVASPSPRPIAATVDGEVAIDELTAPSPDAGVDATSNLFRGKVLYDLDARPGPSVGVSATPLDGIAGFAQDLVIGLNEDDFGDVRISN